MDETPRITVTADGPYLVTGGLPVVRRRIAYSEHGEPMTWEPEDAVDPPERVVLCRCGGVGGQTLVRRHARHQRVRWRHRRALQLV